MSDEVQELLDAIIQAPSQITVQEIQTSDGQVANSMREQAILHLVQHPQTQVRQQAAELLGDISHHENACQALLKLSGDVDSEVRQAALVSLGNFDRPECTAILIKALQDADYLIRATAAEQLARHSSLEIPEALMESLKDSDPMVRATAAESLGRMEAFLAAPALRDLLLDSDQWVRYSSAESLAQIEPDEAIWPLLMNANSADLPTRVQAIQDLGALADRRAIPWLLMMLNDASELEEAVLTSLENYHDPLVVPALVELAMFTQKPHLREQALLQAQSLNIENTIEALSSWLEPEHPQYAHAAIEALQQLSTESTNPVFLEALKHPDHWVQTVALITLQERHLKVSEQLLQPLLQSDNHDLVRAAFQNLLQFHTVLAAETVHPFVVAEQEWRRLILAENLSNLPLEEAYQCCLQLMQDPSNEIKEACLRSMGRLVQDARILELLLQGTQEADAWVRQAAIESLAHHPAEEVQNRLLTLLQQDEDFLVRAAAAEALSNYQTELSYQALERALNDTKASVRLQAAYALFLQGDKIPERILKQLLADADKTIVLAALQFLKQHPQRVPAEQMKILQASEDLQIRSAAQQF